MENSLEGSVPLTLHSGKDTPKLLNEDMNEWDYTLMILFANNPPRVSYHICFCMTLLRALTLENWEWKEEAYLGYPWPPLQWRHPHPQSISYLKKQWQWKHDSIPDPDLCPEMLKPATPAEAASDGIAQRLENNWVLDQSWGLFITRFRVKVKILVTASILFTSHAHTQPPNDLKKGRKWERVIFPFPTHSWCFKPTSQSQLYQTLLSDQPQAPLSHMEIIYSEWNKFKLPSDP